MKISILIPSVNGFDLLSECIKSVFDNSSGDNEIEIMIKFDFGDDIIKRINELPYLENLKIIISDKGYGYGDIHIFLNDMAKLATGDWYQPLNDDALMLTPNWDKNLEIYDFNKPLILRHISCSGRVGDVGDYYFPYISKKYYDTVGRITGCPSYDGYLLMIADELGIWKRLPVQFYHRSECELKQILNKGEIMKTSMVRRDRMIEKEIDKNKIREIL
jgi:hypothetical protein